MVELTEQEKLHGPAYENVQESNIVPAGRCDVLVAAGEAEVTERGYRIALTMEIKSHSAGDEYKNRLLWPYLPFSGEAFKRGGANTQRAMAQAGLDYISSLFDRTHPDWDEAAEKPQLDFSTDNGWLKMMKFYLTGALTDDAGKEFICSNGGLLNKSLQVKVGKPRKAKDGPYAGIESTGWINILGPGQESAGQVASSDPFSG